MAPPFKKSRGRPRKTEAEKAAAKKEREMAAMQDLKRKEAVVASTSLDKTNRKSGRMSLRPNKKVRLVKGEWISSDEDEPMDQSKDHSEDFKLSKKEASALSQDDEYDPLQEEVDEREALLELENIGADRDYDPNDHLKPTRRSIIYNPKLFAKRRRHRLNKEEVEYETTNLSRKTFLDNKNAHCAGCFGELDHDNLDKYTSISTDLTKNGKSYMDILAAVLSENLDESMIGGRLCQVCTGSLNSIEHHYTAFRRQADSFADQFLLNQKAADADLAGVQEVSDLSTMMGVLNLPLSDIIIHIFENNMEGFDAYRLGPDEFGVNVEHIYCAGIVSQSSMPPAETGQKDRAEPGMITITFDYSTGTISRAYNFTQAEMTKNQIAGRDSAVFLYMVRGEFEALNKIQGRGEKKLYISIEEFARIDPTVILGHRNTWRKIILSSTIAGEYAKQVPSAVNKFVCADCQASFAHFHFLTNHIQTVHVEAPDPEAEAEERQKQYEEDVAAGLIEVKKGADAVDGEQTGTRTGEQPTLEKPFQCEYCDKCFAHYSNFNGHVEHYHGFRRACNVEGCTEILPSIAAFCQHYVNHLGTGITIPTDFKSKQSIELSCPSCTYKNLGIWKLYNHAFIHDSIPRFKCPVCPKRMHKVQNFKDHLLKHTGPENVKTKLCRYCRQLVPTAEFNNHLQRSHPKERKFPCENCSQCFMSKKALEYHMEKHIPKSDWTVKCEICDQMFPSERRLRSHVGQHMEIPLRCEHCAESDDFTSPLALQKHMDEVHPKRFRCSFSKTRFSFREEAVKHFRTSQDGVLFKCSKCDEGQEFNCVDEVEFHQHLQNVHPDILGPGPVEVEDTGETSFICGVCSTGFATEEARFFHVRCFHMLVSHDVNEAEPDQTYDKMSELLGDHIIEYVGNTDEIAKIHSVP